MCGLAGLVDFSSDDPDRELLVRMATDLEHRGPDAEGIWRGGPCGLAHRRLSIIDIATSHQPMQSGDSPIVLTYNGELYNYRELREELRATGTEFSTSGDTEVILKSVARDWAKALYGFDGMFAFAAWDRQRQRLLLARDPIGIKPLFYAQPRPDLVVFGSEIKAILRHPEVERSLDLDSLRQTLRFRAVYGSRTLYAGVRQIEPGCYIEFEKTGLTHGRYYDLAEEYRRSRAEYRGLSEGELVEAGRDLLKAAVRKRLIADVPVGAFLSGGLDSSLITALMKECRSESEETRTFSVGFREDDNSELGFARMVANTLGTTHTEVPMDEKDYMTSFVKTTEFRDAPVSEPADIAIARMSAVARESVKVVLSGEGADEAFCGYPKYGFASTPWILRAGIRFVGPSGTAHVAGLLGLNRRRAAVAARSLSQNTEIDRLAQWFSYLDREALNQLLPGLEWSDEQWVETIGSQKGAMERFADGDALVRMQAVDCLTWLPGNLLERGDRMTMSAGLEARVPFLDRRVIAFGLGIPERMKVRGRSLKWIARRWGDRTLPEAIVRRPKWGFRVPLATWFRGQMRDMLHDYLMRPSGLCGTFGSQPAVSRLLAAHDSGEVDSNLALWTLLAAEVWYQDVFQKVHRAPMLVT